MLQLLLLLHEIVEYAVLLMLQHQKLLLLLLLLLLVPSNVLLSLVGLQHGAHDRYGHHRGHGAAESGRFTSRSCLLLGGSQEDVSGSAVTTSTESDRLVPPMAKAWLSGAAADCAPRLLQTVLHLLHHELVRQADHLRLLGRLLLKGNGAEVVVSRGISLVYDGPLDKAVAHGGVQHLGLALH